MKNINATKCEKCEKKTQNMQIKCFNLKSRNIYCYKLANFRPSNKYMKSIQSICPNIETLFFPRTLNKVGQLKTLHKIILCKRNESLKIGV